MADAKTSTRNVLSLLDKIPDNMEHPSPVVEEDLDCDRGASLATTSYSGSDKSPTQDWTRQDQGPPAVWTEPRQGRKIQTTSLLLRRKRKEKRRHKQKRVLRLRGGCGDDETKDDGHDSDAEEDFDAEASSKQDDDKPDQPSTKDGGQTDRIVGDDTEARPKEYTAQANEDGKRKRETFVDNDGKNIVGLDKDKDPSQTVRNGGTCQGGEKNYPKSNASLEPLAMSVLAGSRQGHVRSLERPASWGDWELTRQKLRPPPLDLPRQPDLAYLNMTVDEAANEDGIEHYDLAKDKYRRTTAQVHAVRQAQRDQRRVAGGIYQCQEDGKESFYLHIMKGRDKLLGIQLVQYEPPQKPRVQFGTFAKMDYERYVQCSAQRVRVNLPEETETGFIWYGHGGNQYPLSTSVYRFCERVDNDIHYSSAGCERITQAPGASQLLCSNQTCGVIFWHLSVFFFHRVKANQFEEAGQEHFAVMITKANKVDLCWTGISGNQTRWTRLEHSPPDEAVQVFPGSLQRVAYVAAEGLLPQCNFLLPAYSPILSTWAEPQPLKRIPSTCNM